MDSSKKKKALERALGEASLEKGDELVFLCPRSECSGKDSPKLSVNVKTDRFHCWRCGWGGRNLVPLLRLKGSTPELAQYLAELDRSWFKKVDDGKKYDKPALPAHFKSLSIRSRDPGRHQALDYLTSRGITYEQVLLYKLGYCTDGEYKNRVVIPSFDEKGRLNFVTARAIFDSMLPRYKNGNFDKDIIFNDYLIDWRKPVIVTEGFFDAVVAGTNAVPLQTNFLSEDRMLFKKIVTSGSEVYFALDKDAFKKQVEIVQKLLEYGVTSKFVFIKNKKDVGSMTQAEFMAARESAFSVQNPLDVLRIKAIS